jgi:nitrate reductase assembly molybdenum cofactor insertion protein NarJ
MIATPNEFLGILQDMDLVEAHRKYVQLFEECEKLKAKVKELERQDSRKYGSLTGINLDG